MRFPTEWMGRRHGLWYNVSLSHPHPGRLSGGRRPGPSAMAADPLPPVSAESRRIAAERFDRANQVSASGNFDYAIQLLLTCTKLDPGNFLFRQTLRRTQKAKYKNNL